MTATNHALSGAVIGLAISQPAIALPLAFASHFMLDAIPHFGLANYEEREANKQLFHRILYADAILLAALLVFLLVAGAGWLAFVCLFLAGSPDFVWAYRYIFIEKFGSRPFPPMNLFSRFHSRIQWSQTLKIGFVVELVFAIVFLFVTLKLL